MSEVQMALLFPFVPVLVFLTIEFLLDITSPPDDNDDDFDGGIMTPVYASNPS